MLRLSFLLKGDFLSTLLRTALASLIFGIIVWVVLFEHDYLSDHSATIMELTLLFYGIIEGVLLMMRMLRNGSRNVVDYVSAIWRSIVVAVVPIVVQILFLVVELLWTFSAVLYE